MLPATGLKKNFKPGWMQDPLKVYKEELIEAGVAQEDEISRSRNG